MTTFSDNWGPRLRVTSQGGAGSDERLLFYLVHSCATFAKPRACSTVASAPDNQNASYMLYYGIER